MADEMNPVESSESEAAKKQALPDSLKVSTEPIERGEYLKTAEDNKELAKQYGFNSYSELITKTGSDAVFATQVIDNLASGKKGQSLGLHPNSPQENNLTGNVDRTLETPTRKQFDGQSTSKPVNA